MGLVCEILGLVIFLGAHVFVTMRDRRAALVKAIGEGPYKGLFSLISLVGILLIGYGFALYRDAGLIPLWSPPAWTRQIVVVLMWPASILLAAAYIPGHIKRAVKNPLLIAVKTWAVAHLCANGDLGGIILFGSLLLWAGFDRMTLKRRTDPGAPPIPIGGARNDIIAVIVGTIIYLALGLVFHPIVIGLPAFQTPALGL
ncbi:MAG: NnrU family protein [Xanthobacteraceae bacterium]